MLSDKFNEEFIFSAEYRAKQLIDMGIWSGIEKHHYFKWIKQFESFEERLLASLLSNEVVYRSKEQLKSLLYQSIDKGVPQAKFEKTGDFSEFRKFSKVCDKYNPPDEYIIVPVIKDNDPPTKSGPLIARLYKRLVGVNESIMKWPWSLGDLTNVSTVIFVDDFLGTGNQFQKFFEHHDFKSKLGEDIQVIYCPLTASSGGIQALKEFIPNLYLSPIEETSYNDNFFKAVKNKYKLDSNELDELFDIYLSFLRKVKMHKLGGNITSKTNMAFGYMGLSLTFAYDHATPNASLPLLWASNSNYLALFTR